MQQSHFFALRLQLEAPSCTVPRGKYLVHVAVFMLCRTSITVLCSGAQKQIKQFQAFCNESATSLDLIKRAYDVAADVAEEPPFLIRAKDAPTVFGSGWSQVYQVETRPGGGCMVCESEQVVPQSVFCTTSIGRCGSWLWRFAVHIIPVAWVKYHCIS